MQASLFGLAPPSVDPTFRGARRLPLSGGAWVEHVPSWLTGHQRVFDALHAATGWRSLRREMYGHEVDVPRLVARLPDDGPVPPVLLAARDALGRRYGRPLHGLSANLYRTGHDSVAWHGDRLGPLRPDTVVAILSTGGPRRFLLRPRGGGAASLRFVLGEGDLLVMGGSCQDTWEHCVPKATQAAPRISVMFRERLPGDANRP